MIRLESYGICKDPSLRGRMRLLTPLKHDVCELCIQGKEVCRALCLHLIDSAIDHAASDLNRGLLEIEITPLEAENFGDSKTGALREYYHTSVWLIQLPEHCMELFVGQHRRRPRPFAHSLEFHQLDGISLQVKQFPKHRLLK